VNGKLRFDSLQAQRFFSFLQQSYQLWSLISLLLNGQVKQPSHESDCTFLSGAMVQNAWSYTSIPPYIFIPFFLIKHRDKFSFYLLVNLSD
jgi:hypothetical protein